jgi:hypothetical protein
LRLVHDASTGPNAEIDHCNVHGFEGFIESSIPQPDVAAHRKGVAVDGVDAPGLRELREGGIRAKADR